MSKPRKTIKYKGVVENTLRDRGYEPVLNENGEPTIIGSGAFGVIYLVKDRYGQLFAVKVAMNQRRHRNSIRILPRGHNDEVEIAQALKDNSNEYIVKFVDTILLKGFYIIVMEYINGMPLSRFLGKQMDKDNWFTLAMCLISAVLHIFRMSIVHRDIKPDNIMVILGDDGKIKSAKLVDFGLSRRVGKAPAPASAIGSAPTNSSAFEQEQAYESDPIERGFEEPARKRACIDKTLCSWTETLLYSAPSVHKGPYSHECDNYPLGLVLYGALLGKEVIPEDWEKYESEKEKYWNFPSTKKLEGCDEEMSKIIMLLLSSEKHSIQEVYDLIKSRPASLEQPTH